MSLSKIQTWERTRAVLENQHNFSIEQSRPGELRRSWKPERALSDAPQEANKKFDEQVDTVQKMLSLALRICGVDCLDRQRFISQSLAVDFAYNFRTNFISAGSKVEFLSGVAGKNLKARLRVRYDLA